MTGSELHFALVKVSCAARPARTEAAAWPTRKETGDATAGPTFQGSAVKSTIAQTTAWMEAPAWAHPSVRLNRNKWFMFCNPDTLRRTNTQNCFQVGVGSLFPPDPVHTIETHLSTFQLPRLAHLDSNLPHHSCQSSHFCRRSSCHTQAWNIKFLSCQASLKLPRLPGTTSSTPQFSDCMWMSQAIGRNGIGTHSPIKTCCYRFTRLHIFFHHCNYPQHRHFQFK